MFNQHIKSGDRELLRIEIGIKDTKMAGVRRNTFSQF